MHEFVRTAHAQRRQSQRGISNYMIELIEVFGVMEYQKGGCEIAYLDKRTLATLRNAIEKLESTALVIGASNQLITVIHKSKRITTTKNRA